MPPSHEAKRTIASAWSKRSDRSLVAPASSPTASAPLLASTSATKSDRLLATHASSRAPCRQKIRDDSRVSAGRLGANAIVGRSRWALARSRYESATDEEVRSSAASTIRIGTSPSRHAATSGQGSRTRADSIRYPSSACTNSLPSRGARSEARDTTLAAERSARQTEGMSEYQYYEFVAIDRPLTAKQMAELRAISTRAEITSSRFQNEYQWGDLKADPAKLMERYFDAHLYFANWGTHRMMLRVPLARVDEKRLRAYFRGGGASSRIASDHVVFDFQSDTESPEDFTEFPGSLAALSPLRAEILRGDLRVAYLAWLLAVQSDDVNDEDEEPPVPSGLTDLTGAQQAMVDFLRIDADLLSAAGEQSAAVPDEGAALWRWVASKTIPEKDAWLRQAVEDPELALGGELLRAFRGHLKPAKTSKRRTVGELRAAVEERRKKREQAELARAAKAKRAAEVAHRKNLDALAKRGEAAWADLERLVERSAYDEALTLAVELRDLAAREGDEGGFATRFKVLRKRHTRRRWFFERWKRANEPRRP